MKKLSLAVALAVVAAMVALSATALIARQQTTVRFEYLRVGTYPGQVTRNGQTITLGAAGYRACRAEIAAWNCRDFARTDSGVDDALRTMLVTLGNEGWEVVSDGYDENGLTAGAYLFKRQVR